MKKIILIYLTLFLIGFFGYGAIEIIWRGFTHPSMAIAGGISFCILSVIENKFNNLKFVYRCLMSGVVITLVELIFGYVFNIRLSQNVWNYSNFPFNFYGQVCLIYTTFWCFLSAPFLVLTRIINNKILSYNIS